MEITASLVKELRERTGAGMMDCKAALSDASGDIEIAIEVRPEYDSGTVDTDVLLDETMESNYELNVVDVVDVNEVGDDLENAEIIGDLPEEVEI